MNLYLITVVVLCSLITGCHCCGGITHTEIGHRAAEFFQHKSGNTDYRQLINKHQDAFKAGNPYPDTFYDNICEQGKYHDVSEDTHWSEFINATVNHIRNKYPKPWDEDTEKLVVFLLGFVSHDVADISWHSLGIPEGFLVTMGKVNFFGVFEDAHDVGDPGGDVAAMFEFQMDYIHSLSEWYLPVKDLIEIYEEFYGKKIITPAILIECSAFMFLARLGEKLVMSKVYPMYSGKSPFMMEQYQSFFLGGVDDMAVWSQNIWHDTIYMVEHGMQDCDVPHNPLYITCNRTSHDLTEPQRYPGRNPAPPKLKLGGLTLDDVIVKSTPRGVYLSASKHVQERMYNLTFEAKKSMKMKKLKADHLIKPNATYTVNSETAHLGWSVITGDINNDNFFDLIIGAPGHSSSNNYQQGRVYIVYGNAKGLPLVNKNLNHAADKILDGLKVNGKFGSAIAVVDLNADGFNDLVVSAPSVGSDTLTYTGEVYVYYGSLGKIKTKPDLTITCKDIKYCNLGVSLSVGDLNQDGFDDLVIGSPFARIKNGGQRGMVNVLLANKTLKGINTLSVEDTNHTIVGQQDYSWFGYEVSVETVTIDAKHKAVWLLVSSPTYRICVLKNCSYTKNDTQSVGKLDVFDFSQGKMPSKPLHSLTGVKSFGKLGSTAATGRPYPGDQDMLAVTADTLDVPGKLVEDISVTFNQAGRLYLYNVSSLAKTPTPVASFSGDRSYARFGGKIFLQDVTGDDIDDIIVGAPFRIDDLTEELYGGEEGRVYMFKGGSSLPRGDVTNKCGSYETVMPCPALKAAAEYGTNEAGSRFGSDIAVLRYSKGNNLIVSAVHSNQGARLSGAVHIFNVK
ncbi:phosphatidylinositol-glycan-specific phospholipase D-like [Ptychodera flava]|uniref:phosphatidylinositol-glycan-specific phospholipase D-like n=1 Tax=Ptychodera flava TaxID=63121 RepID=UPI00396A6C1B